MLIVDIASSNDFPRPDTYLYTERAQWQPQRNKSSSSPFRASWTNTEWSWRKKCLIIPCRFATDQWQRHPRNDGLRNWEKPTATSDRWAIEARHARSRLTRNVYMCLCTSETRGNLTEGHANSSAVCVSRKQRRGGYVQTNCQHERCLNAGICCIAAVVCYILPKHFHGFLFLLAHVGALFPFSAQQTTARGVKETRCDLSRRNNQMKHCLSLKREFKSKLKFLVFQPEFRN